MALTREHAAVVRLLEWMVLVGLAGSVATCPLSATINEDGNWRIETWTETRWVQPGDVIVYRAKVTRLGPAISGARFADARDAKLFSEYGAVTPPPVSVTSDELFLQMKWNLPSPMAQGESFEARYEVETRLTAPLHRLLISLAIVYGDSRDSGGSLPPLPRFVAGRTQPSSFSLSGDTNVITCDGPFNATTGGNYFDQETAEPISAGTGEYFTDPPADLSLGGPLPLELRRHYASRLHSEGFVSSALGRNWMHNFDLRATEFTANQKLIVFDKGKLILFQQVWNDQAGVNWALNFRQEPVPFQLKGTIDERLWLLDPARKRMYRFDAEGALAEISDYGGNRLTVSRDGSGRISQVSDGLGRSLTFSYSGDRLAAVSDGVRQVSYAYDADGHLAAFTDAMGNVTRYSYAVDPEYGPLLTATQTPGGNIPYTQTYDAGRVVRQEDAFGRATTFEYDTPAAGQTRVTRPDGSVIVFTHADERLGTAVRDASGQTTAFVFDEWERPVSWTDRKGGETTKEYDPVSGKLMCYTDAAGSAVTFGYTARPQTFADTAGRAEATFTVSDLTRVNYPDSTSETFTYDAQGNCTAWTGREGQVNTFAYNERGWQTDSANPAGATVLWTYNADGTVAVCADPEAGTQQFVFDALKRLQRKIFGDGTFIGYAYDARDRVTALTDENGHTTQFGFDADGRLANVTDRLGQTTQYAFDAMGRLSQVTDRTGHTTTWTRDAFGRPVLRTDPNGLETFFHYDARGWLDRVEQGGRAWLIGRDAEGVPVAWDSPSGQTEAVVNNPLGLPVALTDPLGHTTSLERDSRQRITRIEAPETGAADFTFNGWDSLASAAQESLGTAVYEHDAMGALTGLTDLNGRRWEIGYTPMGRPSRFTDPLGRIWSHAFDARGRLSTTTYPDGDVLTRHYDDCGNLTGLSYASGLAMTFVHDAERRVTSAPGAGLTYDPEGHITATAGAEGIFGAGYDAGGRLATLSYGDGQFTVTYTYDATSGLLARVSDNLTGARVDFSYDADRRLAGLSRSNGVATTYIRDGAGRLTGIHHGTLAQMELTRDGAGRVTAVEALLPLDPAQSMRSERESFDYDAACRLEGNDFAYDPRGRLTTDTGQAFTWDAAGRLVAAGDVQFGYDGFGCPVTRTHGGSTAWYAYNHALPGHPLVAEKASAGAPWRRFYVYTPEGRLLYLIDAGGPAVSFYHFDPSGHTVCLSDASGVACEAYAYSPYGELAARLGSVEQPFTFAGEWGVRRILEDDLYLMGARWYDARTARFLLPDPLWPQLDDLQSLNPYAYARQSPLSYIDASGLSAKPVIDPPPQAPASNNLDPPATTPAGGSGIQVFHETDAHGNPVTLIVDPSLMGQSMDPEPEPAPAASLIPVKPVAFVLSEKEDNTHGSGGSIGVASVAGFTGVDYIAVAQPGVAMVVTSVKTPVASVTIGSAAKPGTSAYLGTVNVAGEVQASVLVSQKPGGTLTAGTSLSIPGLSSGQPILGVNAGIQGYVPTVTLQTPVGDLSIGKHGTIFGLISW